MHLKLSQRLTGIVCGGVIGYLLGHIVYKQWMFSSLLAVLGGVVGTVEYNRYLYKKHTQSVLYQFNDLLESLFNSYAVGKNTLESFQSAKEDLQYHYPKQTFICQEVSVIVSGLLHGYSMEMLLHHFSKKVDSREINDFISVFSSVYRTGGDLKWLMLQSKELISRKIAIELEIMAVIHEQQQQVYILLAMPFVLLVLMDWFQLNGKTQIVTPAEFIGRTIALLLFAIGYIVAKRIVESIRG